MLGSVRLLESYLDSSCADFMVSYFDPELCLCRSWLRTQRGILTQKLISRPERYRQAD